MARAEWTARAAATQRATRDNNGAWRLHCAQHPDAGIRAELEPWQSTRIARRTGPELVLRCAAHGCGELLFWCLTPATHSPDLQAEGAR